MAAVVKDSREYGWLSVSRSEYEALRKHNYAGTGTPLHPDRPGYWVMVLEVGGTTLYTGVSIAEEVS